MPEVYGADDVGDAPEIPEETLGASIGTVTPGTSTAGMKAASIPQRDPTTVYDEYKVPAISDILKEHEPQTADYSEEELNAIGKMLEEKLENFKVKGRVIGCETGPMITRFEVEPGPGMKVSRFSALQEDLALPLRVSSVRILAPIPGKAAVGIEIPNRKFQTVYSLDVFQSEKFKPSPEKLLGRGDMLYKAVNDPEPVRVHGAFLSDEDGEGGGKDLGKLDKLLYDVAVWAVECRGLSTSAVQRHFSVGFSRAGKIVDRLYSLGVCGPAKGNSKPRAMLLGIKEIQSMQRSGKFG